MRCSLQFASDWFVTREWIFYHDYYDGGNWNDEGKFRKAYKHQ